ncbi:hypothetical protein ACQKP8_27190 [Photobacterium alginatilyticum]|uniref:hypothetical protein n=1 Tax=Photobacterium alginatilyticum TaxID=1775171 RepID=UPI0040686AC4
MTVDFESRSIIALVAAATGFFSAIIVQFLNAWISSRRDAHKSRLEKMGIISAFRAEIRVYKKQLKSRQEQCEVGKSGDMYHKVCAALAKSNINEPKIYEAYIDSIGQLGPFYSEQIVRFYASLESVRNIISQLDDYLEKDNMPNEQFLGNLENLLTNSMKRAKILDAILTASMDKGIISEKKQLQAERRQP